MSTATEDQEVDDGWGTDKSSGFLNDYEGTVTDAYFATDPAYNQGSSLLLHLVTSVDNRLEEGFDEVEEITQKYPTGPNWVSEDGGRTAQHTSGSTNKRFHASSLYGKIIDEVMKAGDGYGNATLAADGGKVATNLAGAFDIIRGRGKPTVADVWKGLRLRFTEVVFDYGINKKTGDPMVSRRAMPVEFLGVEGDEGAASNGSTPASAEEKPATQTKAEKAKAAAAAKKAAATQSEAGGTTDPARAKLEAVEGVTAEQTQAILALLAEADDQQTFVDACLEVDGVLENDALIGVLVDDAEGSLWSSKGA